MFGIIRVRGKIGVNEDIERTMKLLNLTRVNHCVVYPENDKIKGMLKKAKDYVTWGELDVDVFKKILTKRGKVYSQENKLVSFSKMYDVEKYASQIIEGKTTLKKLNVKPVFRLKPPSKGYDRKGVKKSFKEGGALGYRAEKINLLLKKMI